MSLPIYQSLDQPFSLMQTNWASQLNPLLSNPINKGIILPNVALVSGDNIINHKLGRNIQGWMVTDMTIGFAQIYRKVNANPLLSMTLNSNATTTINLLVF